MTTRVRAGLAAGPHIYSFLSASVHSRDTFSLSFCRSNPVHPFSVMFQQSWLSLALIDMLVSQFSSLWQASISFLPSWVILISYLFIFVTILKMHSAEGYQKALSTCASHLTTVSIFYGTAIFMYSQPSSSHSMDTHKIASVFCTMVILMLNALVYSLRNKEVKSAFKKAVEKANLSLGFTF